MRLLASALVAAASLSFVSLVAEPAQAVGICADESGDNGNPDLYNNMGWNDWSDCDGMVCYAYTGGSWQTCVPPTIYCATSIVPCQPPIAIEPCELDLCVVYPASSAALALCAYGDLYNNQAGQPSSGCDGALCTGFSDGDWKTCVLDCTADGCPRLWEDPCGRLMCQPPMDP